MQRHMLLPAFIVLSMGAFGSALVSSSAEFTVDTTDRGVTINLDGKLFTEYLIKSGNKPILWPIIGPTGKPMNAPVSDEF